MNPSLSRAYEAAAKAKARSIGSVVTRFKYLNNVPICVWEENKFSSLEEYVEAKWKIHDSTDLREAISAFLASLAKDEEPVAYLHTMHRELGQKIVSVSVRPKPPWGKRGEDYDQSYKVTTEPLFRAAWDAAEIS